MKKAIFSLLLLVSISASAWDVPKYYLKDIKPAFSAPFVKESKKVSTDFFAVYNPVLYCSIGQIGFSYSTNNVSYDRWWIVEFFVTPGSPGYPYITVRVHSPAGYPSGSAYIPINWACNNTLDGNTWSYLE